MRRRRDDARAEGLPERRAELAGSADQRDAGRLGAGAVDVVHVAVPGSDGLGLFPAPGVRAETSGAPGGKSEQDDGAVRP